MFTRKGLSISISVSLLLGGVGIVLFSTPIQIAYHKYSLEQLHKGIYSKPSVITGGLFGYGDSDKFEQQDEHCHRLAELGYFFHKRYEMENLPDAEGVHGTFWKLVQKEFPDRRYPTLSSKNALEVWDLAEHKQAWDSFVDKHNVSDFEEQFMKTENASGQ